MRYSRKVSFGGFLICVAGLIDQSDAVLIGGFLALAAACVCRSIEDLKEG